MSDLLPPSATALEHAFAGADAAALAAIPVPLRTLWHPDTCPLALLPYLAWAVSVDRWDPEWAEGTKRQVIRDAFFVHAHKGTVGALRRVAEPFGYDLTIEEWWQTEPAGEPGTFSLIVGVDESGISPEIYAEVERLVDDAKPLSRHLAEITISIQPLADVYIGFGTVGYDVLTIYAKE